MKTIQGCAWIVECREENSAKWKPCTMFLTREDARSWVVGMDDFDDHLDFRVVQYCPKEDKK